MSSSAALLVVASLCAPSPPKEVILRYSFFVPPASVFTAGWVESLPLNVMGSYEATFMTREHKVYRIRSQHNPGMPPGTRTFIAVCNAVG